MLLFPFWATHGGKNWRKLAGKKLAEKIAVFLESQWHNILI
jgi:hypothetical protein